MKFRIHVFFQVMIFTLVFFALGLQDAVIITAYHFIPSLDFFMKKINFHPKLHRELFHNIFIVILASLLGFYFLELPIAVLATLNLIFHITMDLTGKGEAIFFPFSKSKFKV
ncbi:MAG: hypothetical protein JXA43_03710 [Candidatus Diapherotrites archaeon]|nr:hypothetical protein [Candidatus Diapherotrites archaeon]